MLSECVEMYPRPKFGIVQILKIIEKHVNFNVVWQASRGLVTVQTAQGRPSQDGAETTPRRPERNVKIFGEAWGESFVKSLENLRETQGSNEVVGWEQIEVIKLNN